MTHNGSKGYRGMGMNGFIARWYAKNALKDMDDYRKSAGLVTADLQPGASVLELASGPGLLAIEIARSGSYRVAGLDISQTFVEISQKNAQLAGVDVDFRLGNAAAMPYSANEWDFIVCRAAFKNFSNPVASLDEMHRVLKLGGRALIQDLRSDVPDITIDEYVDKMGRSGLDRWITRWTFKNMLVKRAYSEAAFHELASKSVFGRCDIRTSLIELQVWLRKS
jgi:ubiquinone/menaquinone biosynthesis C-methylase UbiE